MELKDNILTIGDIHGRSRWKEAVFGGETEFFHWKQAVENDYENLVRDEYSFHKYRKIIFVGDYVDSYEYKNEEILENLKDIVLFARTYSDIVVLLLGNHDVQYILTNECCSGYRPEMRTDLNEIFVTNKDLFKLAHLDEFGDGKKTKINRTLWTHAGVTYKWFNQFKKDINSPSFRFYDFFMGSENWKIDKLLNVAWDLRVDNLFDVDAESGGFSLWAGPLWVRPRILNDFYLEGYDQVVGHTPQGAVYQFCPLLGVESNPDKLDTLTYVDAVEQGDFYILSRYK